MNPVQTERELYDRLASEDGDSSSNYYRHAGPDLRLKALLRAAARLRPKRILEVGCADGHVLDSLRNKLGTTTGTAYYGVDISQLSLKRAKSKGFSLLALSDAQQLPLCRGCCDLAIASQVLEHLPDHRKALDQISSVLKPGGHLLLTVPMADWFKLYKGLVVRSPVKFIDEETHQREWSLVPFQKFTAVGGLLDDLNEAGFVVESGAGVFYGSWRLERICDRILLQHPALFEIAVWFDSVLGNIPGLRWIGRYALVIARKK